eukprot:31303-Pelagococcus_subviridis.AAC.17
MTKHLSCAKTSTSTSPASSNIFTTAGVSQNGVFGFHSFASYDAASAHSPLSTNLVLIGPASTTVEVTNTPPGASTLATSRNPNFGSGQQCAAALACAPATLFAANGRSPTSALAAANCSRPVRVRESSAMIASNASAALRVIASL